MKSVILSSRTHSISLSPSDQGKKPRDSSPRKLPESEALQVNRMEREERECGAEDLKGEAKERYELGSLER